MGKITRKQKREKESKINFLAEFKKIQNHFFKDLIKKFSLIKDVRHKSYITYEPQILLFTVIMK